MLAVEAFSRGIADAFSRKARANDGRQFAYPPFEMRGTRDENGLTSFKTCPLLSPRPLRDYVASLPTKKQNKEKLEMSELYWRMTATFLTTITQIV